MVVWQFTTIAALIGAVLMYVVVLTNRLANTNAVLKRIEEALARPQPVEQNVPAAAVERRAAQEAAPPADAEEVPAAAVPDRDRRVSLLTVRDLKVIARSGRRSSDSTLGVSPLFAEVFGNKLERVQSQPAGPAYAVAETAPPVGSAVVSEEPVIGDIQIHVAGGTSTAAVVEELAAATSEIRQFLHTAAMPVAVGESLAAIAAEKPVDLELEPPLSAVEVAVSPRVAANVEPAASGLEMPVLHREPAASGLEMPMLPKEPAVSDADPPVAPVESAACSVEPPPPLSAPDIIAANEDAPLVPEASAAAAVQAPSVDAELEEKRRRDQQQIMMIRRRRRMR